VVGTSVFSLLSIFFFVSWVIYLEANPAIDPSIDGNECLLVRLHVPDYTAA
jgi:hypothetical protein